MDSRDRTPPTDVPRWDLDAEAIAVKIRWFGLLLGFAYVNLGAPTGPSRPSSTPSCCSGSAYTLLDTWFYRRRRVFLGEARWSSRSWRRCSSACLCVFEHGLDSPFRYYYLLSLSVLRPAAQPAA